MVVVDSEDYGFIVVCENKEEWDECVKKADEIDACIYTKKELDYLSEELNKIENESDRKKYLGAITKVKMMFKGFLDVPKNWKPNAEK